ncbi:hypothetical protein O9G_004982 [Rozella allomycis CSF55]|uniref:Protein kinase domain-containing protein n=1 Tax=Rozella allomycis (strain CSF55) TaxID=988480 RepID=A0A075AZS9_ROZAC|nr:hypothetical protein O9G_004982 [Rozella allomycis CSF55]|eukprot:EPZ35599.1 hypothetical protein O9G_004982 [Rozella allomycis CSF55]
MTAPKLLVMSDNPSSRKSMALLYCARPPLGYPVHPKNEHVRRALSKMVKEKKCLEEWQVKVWMKKHLDIDTNVSLVVKPNTDDTVYKTIVYLISDSEDNFVRWLLNNPRKTISIKGWDFQAKLFDLENDAQYFTNEYKGTLLFWCPLSSKVYQNGFPSIQLLKRDLGIPDEQPISFDYEGRVMKELECSNPVILSAFLCGYDLKSNISVNFDVEQELAIQNSEEDREVISEFSEEDVSLMKNAGVFSCLRDKIIDLPMEPAIDRGLLNPSRRLSEELNLIRQHSRQAFTDMKRRIKNEWPMGMVECAIEFVQRTADINMFDDNQVIPENTVEWRRFVHASEALGVDPILLASSIVSLRENVDETTPRSENEHRVDYFSHLLDTLSGGQENKQREANFDVIAASRGVGNEVVKFIDFVSFGKSVGKRLPLLSVEEKAYPFSASNWSSRDITLHAYYKNNADYVKNSRCMKIFLNRRTDEQPRIFGALLFGKEYRIYVMSKFKGNFTVSAEIAKSSFALNPEEVSLSFQTAYETICDFLTLNALVKKEAEKATFMSVHDSLRVLPGDPLPTPRKPTTQRREQINLRDDPRTNAQSSVDLPRDDVLTPVLDPTQPLTCINNEKYNVTFSFHHTRYYRYMFRAIRNIDGLDVILKRSVNDFATEERILRNSIALSCLRFAVPLLDVFWDNETTDLSQLCFTVFRVYVFPAYEPVMSAHKPAIEITFPVLKNITFGIITFLIQAHNARIVHCDIHPWNILLNGNDVAVADYDIAREIGDLVKYPFGKAEFVHEDVNYLDGRYSITVEPYMDIFGAGATIAYFSNFMHDSGLEESQDFLKLASQLMEQCDSINLSDVIQEIEAL